jgi:hypothetical protein
MNCGKKRHAAIFLLLLRMTFTMYFTAMCTLYSFNDVQRRLVTKFGPISVRYLFNMIDYPPAKINVKCFNLSLLSLNWYNFLHIAYPGLRRTLLNKYGVHTVAVKCIVMCTLFHVCY